MQSSLFDRQGARKYLAAGERKSFVEAALQRDKFQSSFCLTMVFSGGRISEVMMLTPERVDNENGAIVIETLKRRKRGIFRAVPMPDALLSSIWDLHVSPGRRIWPWSRTTAWKIVKSVMQDANIPAALCVPKALRHGFGVAAGQRMVPLNVTQRWLGHARIETTAIYADAIGDEERALARRSWNSLEELLHDREAVGSGDIDKVLQQSRLG